MWTSWFLFFASLGLFYLSFSTYIPPTLILLVPAVMCLFYALFGNILRSLFDETDPRQLLVSVVSSILMAIFISGELAMTLLPVKEEFFKEINSRLNIEDDVERMELPAVATELLQIASTSLYDLESFGNEINYDASAQSAVVLHSRLRAMEQDNSIEYIKISSNDIITGEYSIDKWRQKNRFVTPPTVTDFGANNQINPNFKEYLCSFEQPEYDLPQLKLDIEARRRSIREEITGWIAKATLSEFRRNVYTALDRKLVITFDKKVKYPDGDYKWTYIAMPIQSDVAARDSALTEVLGGGASWTCKNLSEEKQ